MAALNTYDIHSYRVVGLGLGLIANNKRFCRMCLNVFILKTVQMDINYIDFIRTCAR